MAKETALFLTWFIAAIASLGSLFFSEVMAYPPCALCWYQRICMYPLVVVLLPAVFSYDKQVLKYTLPLAFIGLLVSVYHNFVYIGWISEALSPCSQGVSCKAKFIQWFGFIDIPQLSLLAFILIFFLLLSLRGKNEK